MDKCSNYATNNVTKGTTSHVRVNFASDAILAHIPVTSTSDNVTYANVFCAICHGISDFWFWNVQVNLTNCFYIKLAPRFFQVCAEVVIISHRREVQLCSFVYVCMYDIKIIFWCSFI